MFLWTVFLCLCSLSFTASALISRTPRPRPLVLWHGLGDSHSSPGMLQFQDEIKKIHPGIFIHSIYIEEDLGADRSAGFYGNVIEQIALVADQIAGIEELQGGFDAIGFSQGGQFLRAYVELYSHAVAPVRNLITFGSQHMGISDLPVCGRGDIPCQLARRLAKKAVYGKWAQKHLIQAQYFRDPTNLETYLASNHFLTLINNEIPDSRNETFALNLSGLDKLVLILFDEDRTVVPKESAWFGSEDVLDEDMFGDQTPLWSAGSKAKTTTTTVPMHEHPLYTEDWIGLRALDERGAVVFETCNGEHMRIGTCWEDVVRNYTGSLE